MSLQRASACSMPQPALQTMQLLSPAIHNQHFTTNAESVNTKHTNNHAAPDTYTATARPAALSQSHHTYAHPPQISCRCSDSTPTALPTLTTWAQMAAVSSVSTPPLAANCHLPRQSAIPNVDVVLATHTIACHRYPSPQHQRPIKYHLQFLNTRCVQVTQAPVKSTSLQDM
jgi:hypothetical protein